MKLIKTLLLIWIIGLLFPFQLQAKVQNYTCPMHPHYIASEMGSCPICGMDLVALDSDDEDELERVVEEDQSFISPQTEKYTCPMHPHYIASEMGSCPICGMDLVALEVEDAPKSSKGKGFFSGKNKRRMVKISPEVIQNTGVRTEKAVMALFGTNVRSYGIVRENMRLITAVSGRVSGWIKDLKITAVGDELKKGDLLFRLYSPELIAAQKDYLSSFKTSSTARIQSTAKRLYALGADKKALTIIRKTGRKIEHFPFYSQANGVVSSLKVLEGSFVKPGLQIATIVDYSSVWIEVSVAEQDLQFLEVGSHAEVSFPNLGQKKRMAEVDYIYPSIDENSRTGQVRLVLENKDGLLKPGAYADVDFETKIDKRLSVASEAILKSAVGNFVIIDLGEGRFQPEQIEVGIYNKGRTEVLKGLSEGDNVVVSSQFMIDSESALKESFRKLQKTQAPLSDINLSEDQQAMIDHLIDAALYLHEARIEGFTPQKFMLEPSVELKGRLMPMFRGTKLEFILEDSHEALVKAQNAIIDTESNQALSDLVIALKPWVKDAKPDYYHKKGVRLFFDHESDLHWIQLKGEIKNPYGKGHSVGVDLKKLMEKNKFMSMDQSTGSKRGMKSNKHSHSHSKQMPDKYPRQHDHHHQNYGRRL